MVSGAGPAGSYAAYGCAKRGLKVLLLDKGAPGRRKCCAGGLLGRTTKALDFRLPDDIIESRVRGFSFVAEGVRYSFPFGEELATVVRREALDAYLVGKAKEIGVEVLEDAKVMSGSEDGAKVMVITTKGRFDARFLVIAEGAAGPLADSFCGKNQQGRAAMGCAVEVKLNQAPRDEIDLHLSSYSRSLRPPRSFPLTGAVFPLRGSVMVSFVDRKEPRTSYERVMNDAFEVLEGEYGGLRVLGKPCYHPLPIAPRSRLHSRRALVIGDAAGLVSPFSGEGLTSAFLSAKAAAEVLVEAHAQAKPRLDRYDSLCAKYLLHRLRAAGMLGPFMHYMVNVIGHQRLFSNLKEDDELINSCAAFARGEMEIPDFALKAVPRLPGLFLGH